MMCRHLIAVTSMIRGRIGGHLMMMMRHARMRGAAFQAAGAQSDADGLQDQRKEGENKRRPARNARRPPLLPRLIVSAYSHVVAPGRKGYSLFQIGATQVP